MGVTKIGCIAETCLYCSAEDPKWNISCNTSYGWMKLYDCIDSS